MIAGDVFWPEVVRVTRELMGKALGELIATGTAVHKVGDVVETDGHRPALLDEDGRRWLLDGSGEVA